MWRDMKEVFVSCPMLESLQLHEESGGPHSVAVDPQDQESWPAPSLRRLIMRDVPSRFVEALCGCLPLNTISNIAITFTYVSLDEMPPSIDRLIRGHNASSHLFSYRADIGIMFALQVDFGPDDRSLIIQWLNGSFARDSFRLFERVENIKSLYFFEDDIGSRLFQTRNKFPAVERVTIILHKLRAYRGEDGPAWPLELDQLEEIALVNLAEGGMHNPRHLTTESIVGLLQSALKYPDSKLPRLVLTRISLSDPEAMILQGVVSTVEYCEDYCHPPELCTPPESYKPDWL